MMSRAAASYRAAMLPLIRYKREQQTANQQTEETTTNCADFGTAVDPVFNVDFAVFVLYDKGRIIQADVAAFFLLADRFTHVHRLSKVIINGDN